MKQIQKKLDEKFQEMNVLLDIPEKANPHLFYANFVSYLYSIKEVNIAKKAFLELSSTESLGKSLFELPDQDPLLVKIKDTLIGKGDRYPKDQPKLD